MDKGLTGRDKRFAELDTLIMTESAEVIERRSSPEASLEPLQRTLPLCKYCGEPFTPNPRNHTKINQDFCNSKCRWKQWDMENPRKRKGQ